MKTYLALIFMLIATPVWSEWVKVADHSEGILYIDPATIRKDGNLRKVWEMQNLQQLHKTGYMSLLKRLEYDCKEERVRDLFISAHTGSMGTGETLLSGSPTSAWEDIAPNSANETNLKIVCAK